MPNAVSPLLPAYYAGLTPDAVLAAVEMLGLVPDGRLLSLNSYENRVYRIGLEMPYAGGPSSPAGSTQGNGQSRSNVVVAKFYRERRWSDAQIREEHAFIAELAAAGLPVASPLPFGGQTLHLAGGYRYALFECRPGAAPDLDLPDHRALLGRTLGRLHAVGGRQRFRQRIGIGHWRHGGEARERLLELGAVPAPLDAQYEAISGQLVEAVAACVESVGPVRPLRLHGDCHPGNILWQETGPLFVDFDDSLTGPAVQDLWMFASGEPDQMRREWSDLIDGYEQFAHFDAAEARLIEALRAMRMLNHAAWVAQRWSDPAFPRAFPWFGEPRHWERHLHELREQLEALEDPPLLRV